MYFHDYKQAIQFDENGHSDRSIDYEIKRQKAIKQELGVVSLLELILTKETLILLELSMKYLNTLNKRLKNSNKKISTRLLGLDFKSDNIINSKAIKFIVKRLPDYK